MALWFEHSLGTPACHTRVPVSVLTTQLFSQLPTNVPEKAVDNGPRKQVPATCVGEPDGVCGSWFQLGPAIAIRIFQGMNQWDRKCNSLCFPLPLPLCLSNKYFALTHVSYMSSGLGWMDLPAGLAAPGGIWIRLDLMLGTLAPATVAKQWANSGLAGSHSANWYQVSPSPGASSGLLRGWN